MTVSAESAHFALWPLPDLALTPATRPGTTDAAGDPDGAFAEGVEAGRAEAREEARRNLEHALVALQSVESELRRQRQSLVATNEQAVFKLALAVARHVIQREIETDDQIVLHLVRRALEELDGARPTEVRLNPADLDAAQGYVVGQQWPADLEWIADPTMERGSCVVESPDRIIDGRLDTVLREVERRLRDE